MTQESDGTIVNTYTFPAKDPGVDATGYEVIFIGERPKWTHVLREEERLQAQHDRWLAALDRELGGVR